MSHEPKMPPNRYGFLQLAGLFLTFALLVYLLMDSMEYVGSSQVLTALYTVMALFLTLLVAAALLMLFCFSNKRMGAAFARRFQYLRDAFAVPLRHLGLFGYHAESGLDEKRFATKRKLQRQARRHYAHKDDNPKS
ncbi:hypothetical protein GCM10007972_26790 [Iodidimonas muriae]|uniref:Uncharacterized protein n=1 Tax=Iodidimonas muriae TaxID=261467 RepID=A0ABQ2LGZ2_9PROT|nr:hypothetical protein [Iodidimonas muriae]GER08678.1 hypothetical protein JCM17843_29880 [Kordiimonadales bacterium JCM 17843]GGO17034.1 hypothetical protein GCM10007972_26790 [Iodidimonas muriae]